MAHYEDFSSDLSKWKETVLHMDFVTTKFQKKEQDDRSKGQGKKYGLDERIQLRGGESGIEKKKCGFVLKEVCDKRKGERRCMKCRRSNHQAWDCKARSRAKRPPFSGNANQETVQKKRKFNQEHLKIIELGSEKHSANE